MTARRALSQVRASSVRSRFLQNSRRSRPAHGQVRSSQHEAEDVGVDRREGMGREHDREAVATQAAEHGVVVTQECWAGVATGFDEAERPRVLCEDAPGRGGLADHGRPPRLVGGGHLNACKDPVRQFVDQVVLAGDVVVERHPRTNSRPKCACYPTADRGRDADSGHDYAVAGQAVGALRTNRIAAVAAG